MKNKDLVLRDINAQSYLNKRFRFETTHKPNFNVGDYVWVEVSELGDSGRTFLKYRITDTIVSSDYETFFRYDYAVKAVYDYVRFYERFKGGGRGFFDEWMYKKITETRLSEMQEQAKRYEPIEMILT